MIRHLLPRLAFALSLLAWPTSAQEPTPGPASDPTAPDGAVAPSGEDDGGAPDEVASAAAPAAAGRLPADTMLHVEVAGGADLPDLLEGTAALALWRDDELQAFLRPALDGLRDDLVYLAREEDEVLHELATGERHPGRVTISVLSFTFDEEEGEPQGMEMLASVHLPGAGRAVFDALLDDAREGAPGDIVEDDIDGRPAFTDESHAEARVRLVLDGDDLVLHVVAGEKEHVAGATFTRLFGRQDTLADDADFAAVHDAVGGAGALVFAYGDFATWWDLMKSGLSSAQTSMARMTGDDEAEREMEAARRYLEGVPGVEDVDGLGYGVAPDGTMLRDRFYVLAPGERSDWGATGEVGDTVARHAGWAGADADLFASGWFDLADMLLRQEKERERLAAIREELDLDEAEPQDPLSAVLVGLEEETGLDVAGLLVPTVGHHYSLHAAVPASGMALPDFGLVVDLVDPEGFDEALDAIVHLDDRIDAVNFSRQDHEEHELLTVKLVGAGLPVLPTLTRVDDTLLVATSAVSLKTLLQDVEAGETLAASERFGAFVGQAPRDANMVLWCDMGPTFAYLYGFIGMGLGMLRMSGAELGERFDASLLPSGDTLASHLGTATFVSTQDEQGLTYEGRSTLGNPLIGTFSGLAGIGGLLGLSEGLRGAAMDERASVTRENLRELARTSEAYRSSVGGGSYPTDLVQLVDRGLLADASKLVDPADPSPKRMRGASGDRVPVSYAIGSMDALPESVRKHVPEGSERVLYTRGAWYPRGSGKIRYLVVLGADDDTVHHVQEDDWGG